MVRQHQQTQSPLIFQYRKIQESNPGIQENLNKVGVLLPRTEIFFGTEVLIWSVSNTVDWPKKMEITEEGPS